MVISLCVKPAMALTENIEKTITPTKNIFFVSWETKTSSKRNFIALGLSVLVAIYALSDLIISNFDSLMLLTVLTYFIYIMAIQPNSDEIVVEQNNSSYLNLSIFLIIGLLSITIGSNYAVINGEKIAFLIGIPKLIIGLTVLAIGTSLPELAVTISALMKQKNQMVLGNIIGSNVLNIAVVMPILGLFSEKRGKRPIEKIRVIPRGSISALGNSG